MTDAIIITLFVMARALHYGTALAMFGYCVFVGYLVPGGAPPATGLAKRLVWSSAPVFTASALIWLAVEAGNVGDGLSDMLNVDQWWSVVVETGFGHALAVQLLIGLLLMASVHAAGPRLLALLWGAALVALAGVGHAVMRDDVWAILLPTVQSLHLLAAGYWVGGLLAIIFRPAGQGLAWGKAFMRFSTIGHAAVALLLVSGFCMSVVLLAPAGAAWNPAYAAILGAKLAVAAGMTAVAVYNRYWLVPRLASSPAAAQRLLHYVRVNLALSAGAILLVSLLGQISPALEH